MDSNELSRQMAARLHAEAVNRGLDPCRPYEFACAEANRREIVVERVPAGDVRLHGSQALYDADALLILHERAEDEFSEAFLVAHELGHVELVGIVENDNSATVDPLRSSEVAPVGIDRVVDYNRRARREIQMDLFAREFLVPRFWLKRLHVDEKLAGGAIAAKCRAPFAVVAQQLFDAILLPAEVPEDTGDRQAKPLKEDQRRAVEHRGRPFLLEAGPGTGKTQTLVGRIADLVSNGGNPNRILVLTFSNKAAAELSDRVSLQNPEAAAAMWIGTFHAFGLDVVRRFHDQLGLPQDVRLLDRSEAIDLLETEYPRLRLTVFKNLWDPSQPL